MRSRTSGSCRLSQAILGPVKPGMGRTPRRRDSARSCARSAASAALRPSFHRMAGRTGRSAASSSRAPCICPDRPMPATRAKRSGEAAASRSRPATTAVHQASASSSDQEGRGWRGWSGSSVPARIACPSASTTLTDEVPASMPRVTGPAVPLIAPPRSAGSGFSRPNGTPSRPAGTRPKGPSRDAGWRRSGSVPTR